ncbi:hypothetical protein CGSSp14BS69_00925 [Streptococcus pneumoniae SP14-BS69]|nr:hypothetical protein CGSSp14BS69_00925 [Streptococcus pneumoniae SP14-BS69]
MLEFPYSLGTHDKNRVDIASLGHYGESYSRSASSLNACSNIVCTCSKLGEVERL